MSELRVHNVRFYDVSPCEIHCMAYNTDNSELALSRSDASIEIWDLSHTPHITHTIPPNTTASVEALTWYNNDLYTTGMHGYVYMYPPYATHYKFGEAVVGGAAWCMVLHRERRQLAVGTEDGHVCLFTLPGRHDKMAHDKVLDRQEGRVLCLSWHVDGVYLAGGSVDYIRMWNVDTGQCITRLQTGRSEQRQETIVWSVLLMSDLTLVSGDSRGKTCFWDAVKGTAISSVQSHKADVLCICQGENDDNIYVSSVDPTIAGFSRVQLNNGKSKWVKSIMRNVHTHDVRTMVYTDKFLISGGVDAYLVMTSYPPKFMKKFPPILQAPSVVLAAAGRCILMRHCQHLELWKLGSADVSGTEKVGDELRLREQPVKLLELQSKGEEFIVCCAMSDDAKFLAYSTANTTRCYSLAIEEDETVMFDRDITDSKYSVKLNKLDISMNGTPLAMVFSPDCTQLIISTDNSRVLVFYVTDEGCVRKDKIKLTTFKFTPVHHLCVSPSGEYLALADHKGKVMIYNLTKQAEHCQLPEFRYEATALAMTADNQHLVVIHGDQTIIEWNITNKAYSEWCKLSLKSFPVQWRERMFTVSNIAFDPEQPHIMMLQDDATITIINRSRKPGPSNAKIPKLYDSSNDSCSATPIDVGGGMTFYKKYKHLVYWGRLQGGEMVAVEVTPTSIQEKLAPTLKTKKFGV